MKKIKYFFMAIVCLMVSNIAKADDTPIPVSQLPAAAKTFLQANFPGINVIYAEKDWNTYECRLQDGTKVEFTRKGAWKKVDRERMAAVPTALVPVAIRQYVKANFPNCSVTKIDKERYGYDVELSNDIELKFSPQGAVIGMDD